MLAEQPLGAFLDDLAARTPAPGGGAAAALAGALAAGLVEMAARFADREERRAAELRARLLELADTELHAYEPLLDALRLPREHPARAERLAAARSAASEPPLEIARAAAEVAALAAELARGGNPNLEGDAHAGRLLAEAACRAAGHLVELNLEGDERDPRVREVRALPG